ncbi:MAG: hypothetical protein MUF38_14795 [Anaerolineae bacterium]|jgi:hypothetical protein|nr:hypothetical protein [Anaerolineae bacterium]
MTMVVGFFYWLLRELDKGGHPGRVYEAHKVHFEMAKYLLDMAFNLDATDRELKAGGIAIDVMAYFMNTRLSSRSRQKAVVKVRTAIEAMERAGFDIPF